jgi:hypothetical protein
LNSSHNKNSETRLKVLEYWSKKIGQRELVKKNWTKNIRQKHSSKNILQKKLSKKIRQKINVIP